MQFYDRIRELEDVRNTYIHHVLHTVLHSYRNISSIFHFILQGHAIAWTVVSRYKGTFETNYGVLTVNKVFW